MNGARAARPPVYLDGYCRLLQLRVRPPSQYGGRASQSCGMSPIGAPGGAGDGRIIHRHDWLAAGRSRKRLMSAAISVCCA